MTSKRQTKCFYFYFQVPELYGEDLTGRLEHKPAAGGDIVMTNQTAA